MSVVTMDALAWAVGGTRIALALYIGTAALVKVRDEAETVRMSVADFTFVPRQLVVPWPSGSSGGSAEQGAHHYGRPWGVITGRTLKAATPPRRAPEGERSASGQGLLERPLFLTTVVVAARR